LSKKSNNQNQNLPIPSKLLENGQIKIKKKEVSHSVTEIQQKDQRTDVD
jgi:hypothetical protein